jgi:hypothetical protein
VVYAIIEFARGNSAYRVGPDTYFDTNGAQPIAGLRQRGLAPNLETIRSEFIAGNPVILRGRSASLGSQHFVLAIGLDPDDNILALDPWGGRQIVIDSSNWTTSGSRAGPFTVVDMRTLEFLAGPTPTPQPLQTAPLQVALGQTNITVRTAGVATPIQLSGSGLNSVTEIRWSCTNPDGTTCVGSPYVWAPSDPTKWNKFRRTSDSSATVEPNLVAPNDPSGTYRWEVTFVGGSQRVAQPFTVTFAPSSSNAPPAATAFDRGLFRPGYGAELWSGSRLDLWRAAGAALPYAKLSAAVYGYQAIDGWKVIADWETILRRGLERQMNAASLEAAIVWIRSIGFAAAVYADSTNRNPTLVFRGSSVLDPGDWLSTNIPNRLGVNITSQYDFGLLIAQLAGEQFRSLQVVTGHSLGGAIAQFVAGSDNSFGAVTFNAEALGRWYTGPSNLSNVTNFWVEGDTLTQGGSSRQLGAINYPVPNPAGAPQNVLENLLAHGGLPFSGATGGPQFVVNALTIVWSDGVMRERAASAPAATAQPPVVPSIPTGASPGSTSSPGPTQSGAQATLRWNSVTGATNYDLGVRDMSTNALVIDQRVSGTSFNFSMQQGRTYKWNVAACNDAGCSGFTTPLYFSASASAAAAPPPPVAPSVPTGASPGSTSSPGPTQSGSQVTLRWNAVSSATNYDLGVRDMSTNALVIDQRVSGASFNFSMQQGRTYKWNVAACNDAGCSSFTTPLYFSASAPAAAAAPPPPVAPSVPTGASPGSTSSPGPTQSGAQVTLRWNAVSGATNYDLGVRDMSTNALVIDQRVSGTSFNFSMQQGRTYKWNVAACSDAGCSGFTTPLYFSASAPAAAAPPPPVAPSVPTGASPGSTSTPGPTQSGSQTTLRWNAVSGATNYDLGVRDMSTNALVIDQRVSGTSFNFSMQPGRTYKWNVAACNAAGCSTFTTPLYFRAN